MLFLADQQCLKKLRPEYQAAKFPDQWQFTRSLDDLLNVYFWELMGEKSLGIEE